MADTQDLTNYDRAYYERDIRENWFPAHGLLRPDQLAAVCYTLGWPFWGDEDYPPRDPGRIMSVGCGRGDLEAELERLGHTVIGVDPSDGASVLYRGARLQPTVDGIETCDTVILCEALEHLPRNLIDDIWSRLDAGTRVIVVNWPTFHPIEATDYDGWDHITSINDDLLIELSAGFNVRVQRGSHLVMDKEAIG